MYETKIKLKEHFESITGPSGISDDRRTKLKLTNKEANKGKKVES